MDILFPDTSIFGHTSARRPPRRSFFQPMNINNTARRPKYYDNRFFNNVDVYNDLFRNDGFRRNQSKAPTQACQCSNCRNMTLNNNYRNDVAMYPREFVSKNQGFFNDDKVYNDEDFVADIEICADVQDECGTEQPTKEDFTGEDDEIINISTENFEEPDVENADVNNNSNNSENDDVEHAENNGPDSDENSENSSDNVNKDDVSEKLLLIENIQKKVHELASKVDSFVDTVKNREYLYCEEMLIKCLLGLDGILADGDESIRKARKTAVAAIHENISKLETKLDDVQ